MTGAEKFNLGCGMLELIAKAHMRLVVYYEQPKFQVLQSVSQEYNEVHIANVCRPILEKAKTCGACVDRFSRIWCRPHTSLQVDCLSKCLKKTLTFKSSFGFQLRPGPNRLVCKYEFRNFSLKPCRLLLFNLLLMITWCNRLMHDSPDVRRRAYRAMSTVADQISCASLHIRFDVCSPNTDCLHSFFFPD